MGVKAQDGGERSLRVLLIEDSDDDAELVLDALRAGGFAITAERVESAAALRQALLRGPFQLVLCDYSLPGFDPLTALAIVKEHRFDLPFIIISGMIDEESAVAALRAGAHDFLSKGKLARLVPAVERELREAKVRAERAELEEQLLLSDRLVQIGILAAGIAHEINNPLAYVIGNLGLALEQLNAASFDRALVLQSLQHALDGSERIRATCADLRVFSRTEEGEPQPVELRRVLDSAINIARNEIRHRARLIKNFSDVPSVVGNENRLGQVFLNLLINAVQSIPEGRADDHRIEVSLRASADAVEVEISDSGIGIAPELRQHLFKPFFTTKPKGVGTGLGLSICQKIIHDSNGQIMVEPNPTGGTIFRVRLPIDRVEPMVQPPQGPPAPSRRPGRVLVIDDEPQIVDLVRRMLRDDHETVGAIGAKLALEVLRRDHDFDLIFCDVMMPDMSGPEFYEVLSRIAPALEARVVFMSGGAFTQSANQFLARVPNLKLHKPFEAATLRSIVRDQLALRDSAAVSGAGAA